MFTIFFQPTTNIIIVIKDIFIILWGGWDYYFTLILFYLILGFLYFLKIYTINISPIPPFTSQHHNFDAKNKLPVYYMYVCLLCF